MNAKELVEYIAKALVDHPDQVKVSEVEGERTSVIELSVAKEDLGKVIENRAGQPDPSESSWELSRRIWGNVLF